MAQQEYEHVLTRESTVKLLKEKQVYKTDEVVDLLFGHAEDTYHHMTTEALEFITPSLVHKLYMANKAGNVKQEKLALSKSLDDVTSWVIDSHEAVHGPKGVLTHDRMAYLTDNLPDVRSKVKPLFTEEEISSLARGRRKVAVDSQYTSSIKQSQAVADLYDVFHMDMDEHLKLVDAIHSKKYLQQLNLLDVNEWVEQNVSETSQEVPKDLVQSLNELGNSPTTGLER